MSYSNDEGSSCDGSAESNDEEEGDYTSDYSDYDSCGPSDGSASYYDDDGGSYDDDGGTGSDASNHVKFYDYDNPHRHRAAATSSATRKQPRPPQQQQHHNHHHHGGNSPSHPRQCRCCTAPSGRDAGARSGPAHRRTPSHPGRIVRRQRVVGYRQRAEQVTGPPAASPPASLAARGRPQGVTGRGGQPRRGGAAAARGACSPGGGGAAGPGTASSLAQRERDRVSARREVAALKSEVCVARARLEAARQRVEVARGAAQVAASLAQTEARGHRSLERTPGDITSLRLQIQQLRKEVADIASENESTREMIYELTAVVERGTHVAIFLK
ncbi:hypothetical protein Pelo_14614 [Pelomyxa schiedti]|nr:hypothetical protein Pelo_14614 [Pelomyxa schiedti]